MSVVELCFDEKIKKIMKKTHLLRKAPTTLINAIPSSEETVDWTPEKF